MSFFVTDALVKKPTLAFFQSSPRFKAIVLLKNS
jgi:hypothetical protein